MGQRRQILCIDDNADSLKIHGILLESLGYKVWSEPDAEHGLQAFRDHSVDAVVMDYQTPGMSGGQAAEEMKRLRPEVPVIILSALPSLPDDAPAYAIDAFVQKSEPLNVLAARVEDVLRDSQEESTLETLSDAVRKRLDGVAHSFRPRAKATLH